MSDDLSLPTHHWQHTYGTLPDGTEVPEVSIWYCDDCLTTLMAPKEEPPLPGPCRGKGPHNAEHIALAKRVCERFGWALPERLREG